MASSDEPKLGDSAQPTEPREALIGTAVKFLQNAKVRDSPFPQRRKFLLQKDNFLNLHQFVGLTDEEIQLAIDRSGTAGDEATHLADTSPNQSQLVVAHSQSVPAIQTVPASKWNKFRDFTSTAILVGGVSYAVYMICKHYLAPHLFRPSRQERQLEKLMQSVTELQQTVASVLQSIQETQKTLSEQQETLKQTVIDTGAGRGSKEMLTMQNTQFVTEIKEEIKSLKGLMLNRRQFPTAPTTTPMLPAWQLQSSQQESSTESSKSKNGVSAKGDTTQDNSQSDIGIVTAGTVTEISTTQSEGESATVKEGEMGIQAVKSETAEQSGEEPIQEEEETTKQKQLLSGELSQGLEGIVQTEVTPSLTVNGMME